MDITPGKLLPQNAYIFDAKSLRFPTDLDDFKAVSVNDGADLFISKSDDYVVDTITTDVNGVSTVTLKKGSGTPASQSDNKSDSTPAWLQNPNSPAAIEYKNMLSHLYRDPAFVIDPGQVKSGSGMGMTPAMQGSKCLDVFDAVSAANHLKQLGTYQITPSDLSKNNKLSFKLTDAYKGKKVKLITVEKGGAYHIYDNSSTTPGVFEADITYPGAAVLCIEE